MKLHLATTNTQNSFTGHGEGFVLLNGRKMTQSIIVTPEQVIENWAPSGFDALTQNDFQALLELSPEIILLGSGARFRFLPPVTTKALAASGIGVETMDTPAACRTYNVLLAEGRKVAAALIIDSI
jgi:uncharacterized protein